MNTALRKLRELLRTLRISGSRVRVVKDMKDTEEMLKAVAATKNSA